MIAPSWERVERHFLAVRKLEAEEQAAYLESECGGDRALLAEVKSLLA